MLGTPLSKINARTAALEGAHALVNDVRASRLGKETPSAKIKTEGAEISHFVADVGHHLGHLI